MMSEAEEGCRFSVVIPTLNEAVSITNCIRRVFDLESGIEVVVVDSGSTDGTVALAREAGALVYNAPRGRGRQLNAGARVATGDILLFLHADTLLPHGAFSLLREAFADDATQIGTFRLGFDERHWLYSVYTYFSRFDSVLTTFGDQCLVLRKSFFQELGGFPDWPLFEDVALLQKARETTRVRSFGATVITSARRFRQHGIVRQSVHNGWLMVQYLMGVSPAKLAVKYERIRHNNG